MSAWLRVARAAHRLELAHLLRSRLFLATVLLQAVTFLVLVSLFGLVGSRAPTAIVDHDHTGLSQRFTAALAGAHHSFDLRPMSAAEATQRLREGSIVAAVDIPAGFERTVVDAGTAQVTLSVDNVDVDLTDDVQRALPSAISAFGHDLRIPALRIGVVERDAVDHDTGYIPYLVVSALALDALIVAALLAATSVAREWERRTVRVWSASPAPAGAVLAGKLVSCGVVAAVAMTVTTLVVVLGYHVAAGAPLEVVVAQLGCIVTFLCVGAWLGAALRRTLAVAPLLFGLAMPLYFDSGALEPARFDGNAIWALAHLSPLYYAVGILQHAFHGLRVTPEPVVVDMLALLGFALAGVLATRRVLRGAVVRGRLRTAT